jgi:hypothetical protein
LVSANCQIGNWAKSAWLRSQADAVLGISRQAAAEFSHLRDGAAGLQRVLT